MRYAVAVSIAAVISLTLPASAADELPIPTHDVDRACATLKDRALIASCVRDEQYRYDLVSSVWDDLSPERKRECYTFARDQGPTNHAFYKSLSLFVSAQMQMQGQAADAVGPTPRFQR